MIYNITEPNNNIASQEMLVENRGTVLYDLCLLPCLVRVDNEYPQGIVQLIMDRFPLDIKWIFFLQSAFINQTLKSS